MYTYLLLPGQAPQPVPAWGLYGANTRAGHNNPTNLAAAALALGVPLIPAHNLNWSHSYAAYGVGKVWGDEDERFQPNYEAMKLLNALQKGVEYGAPDMMIYGPVLIDFDSQDRMRAAQQEVNRLSR